MLALTLGHSTFTASPAITSSAACSFQGCSGSPSARAEAEKPKIGTSSAIGVMVAAGWRVISQLHTP